jgi:hypothetical protein
LIVWLDLGRWLGNFVRFAFQARPLDGMRIARTAQNHFPAANHDYDVANPGSWITPDGNFRRRVFVGHGGVALDDFTRGAMAPSSHGLLRDRPSQRKGNAPGLLHRNAHLRSRISVAGVLLTLTAAALGAAFFDVGRANWYPAVTTAPSTTAAPTISGPARVIDGDTVAVAGTTVRLKGVDAAELGTARGENARHA